MEELIVKIGMSGLMVALILVGVIKLSPKDVPNWVACCMVIPLLISLFTGVVCLFISIWS